MLLREVETSTVRPNSCISGEHTTHNSTVGNFINEWRLPQERGNSIIRPSHHCVLFPPLSCCAIFSLLFCSIPFYSTMIWCLVQKHCKNFGNEGARRFLLLCFVLFCCVLFRSIIVCFPYAHPCCCVAFHFLTFCCFLPVTETLQESWQWRRWVTRFVASAR